jgi:hypothetical protein
MVSEKSQAVLRQVGLRKEFENKLKQVKKDLLEIEKVTNGKKV